MEAYNLKKVNNLYGKDVVKDGQIVLPSDQDGLILSMWSSPSPNAGYDRSTYIGYPCFHYYNNSTYSSQLNFNTGAYDFFVKGTIGSAVYLPANSRYYINCSANVNANGASQSQTEVPTSTTLNLNVTNTFSQFTPITTFLSNLLDTNGAPGYIYSGRHHYLYFMSDCQIKYKPKS